MKYLKVLLRAVVLVGAFIFGLGVADAQPYSGIDNNGDGTLTANPPTLALDVGVQSTPEQFSYAWDTGQFGRTIPFTSGGLICVEITHPVGSSGTHCVTVLPYQPTKSLPIRGHFISLIPLGVKP